MSIERFNGLSDWTKLALIPVTNGMSEQDKLMLRSFVDALWVTEFVSVSVLTKKSTKTDIADIGIKIMRQIVGDLVRIKERYPHDDHRTWCIMATSRQVSRQSKLFMGMTNEAL